MVQELEHGFHKFSEPVVVIILCGDDIGGFLDIGRSILHGDTAAGFTNHGDIVVGISCRKGPRHRILHRHPVFHLLLHLPYPHPARRSIPILLSQNLICGDYANVVGLPVGRVYQELRQRELLETL